MKLRLYGFDVSKWCIDMGLCGLKVNVWMLNGLFVYNGVIVFGYVSVMCVCGYCLCSFVSNGVSNSVLLSRRWCVMKMFVGC